MPLEEYHKKRDFSATPEPAGGEPSGEKRIFVVQQHHATAMHYDFRLELDGVLLSWAVPKGPSYDPKDKRLAVHVEDHPIDYAGFEGVIPKGEYGGGTVIVWDRGTWEPISDPRAGLEKGDFKFRLSGEKLVGGWVLVRLKPRPGEKRDNWLLIKEKDDMVRPSSEYSVTVEEPLSVISGLRVDDVGKTADADDPPPAPAPAAVASPDSPQPVEAPLVAPPELALCTLVTSLPDTDGWLGEVKYDGYRTTVAIEDGKARFYSRNAKDLTEKVGPLAHAAASLPATTALIDGEIVVFDERGISSFGLLQEALGAHPERIVLAAFDLLYLNGFDLRPLGTKERKELLRALTAGEPPNGPIRYAEYIDDGVPAFMEVACAQGLEGVVAKRANAPYPKGRTRAWLKVKCRRSQEFVVGGFTEPGGSRKGFGALLLGYYDGDRLQYAGRVGSGFSQQLLSELYEQLLGLEQKDSPFDPAPDEGPPLHWVEPVLIAQVAFAEWTSVGSLRQPSFLGLRDDIAPRSVVREAPDAADADSQPEPDDPPPSEEPAKPSKKGAKAKAPKKSAAAEATVAGVRISNPDKQLFPNSALGKLELAQYYEAIAPLMLPEVAHRPLTLVRCPVGGGQGKCFYQRHPDKGLPKFVGTLDHVLRRHDEPDEWLYIEDVAGLVALAQMGVAEIHTWLSRTDEPRRPDRIVFDLDPGPDVSWEQITQAAVLMRDECASLGFKPFVKSTGSKGLHIVLPIEPVWEFDRIRLFAKSIAERIAGNHPAELTPKMSKKLRPGRIFIDYVRNSETASAVAAYSTRYLEGPPVAVPLAWDELDPDNDVRTWFTTTRVLERAAAGIDPWRDIDDSTVGAKVLRNAEGSLPI